MCHQKSIGSQAENCRPQETRMLPDADWNISYHISGLGGGGGVACTNETESNEEVGTYKFTNGS